MYSVKRSDVTGKRFEWEQSYIRPPPPYFTVLASSLTTMDVKAIEFHRIIPKFEISDNVMNVNVALSENTLC